MQARIFETPEATAQRRQSNRLHVSKVRDEETPEATVRDEEHLKLLSKEESLMDCYVPMPMNYGISSVIFAQILMV